MLKTIAAGTGTAFLLSQGDRLRVRSPHGQQVSDLYCYSTADHSEALSTARSLDAAETIFLTKGHALLSNRSRTMLTIVQDTCGRHDVLLPPCREEENGHPGCFENLAQAFGPFGIGADQVGPAFNVFMHVDLEHGRPVIRTPRSKAGDEIVFEAQMDMIVGLTACAHLATNGGELKAIEWEIC